MDPADDRFYDFINDKYKKYKIPAKERTLEDICFPKKYELQIPQVFLGEFMNPSTPYRGIFVYFNIGAGKTCTAINIAEKFKGKKKILVVLPAILKSGFRDELRTQCAGEHYITQKERDQLKKLDPSTEEYKTIIDRTDKRIDAVYTIYSYNKFMELLSKKQITLKDTLLIIDEVHNLISNSGSYYKMLYEAVKSAPSSLRMVMMSATPIFDKPAEIALTMNLLLKDELPVKSDFNNRFIETIIHKNEQIEYKIKNKEEFQKYLRGYISYYRGAPPVSYPKAEYHIVRCKMSDMQKKVYTDIIEEESKEEQDPDKTNVFFVGTRKASNIIFHNKKMGEDGYRSMNNDDYKLSKMAIHSPKFVEIYNRVSTCKGTAFIYSNFKNYGGIKPLATFLDNQGYKNYETDGPGKNRYFIWSGDQSTVMKDQAKAVFNNPDNADGSKIKIILASPSAKEGVSFKRVQQVHLLEPYWNWSRMDQIIGRAFRYCSHKDMPVAKRVVKVFIYIAFHPSIKKSVDEHIMEMAVNKKSINKQFEKAIKETAIDCQLFRNGNKYDDDKDLVCVK